MLNLYISKFYEKEIQKIIHKKSFEDVTINFIPPGCIFPSDKIFEKLTKSIYNPHDNGNSIMLSCSGCRNHLKVKNKEPIENKDSYCHTFLLNKEILQKYIAQKYYIITPGWLVDWKEILIGSWQLGESGAKQFFKQSASGILFLNTGVSNSFENNLKELSEFTGLEYKIENIGLDYFENYLTRKILELKITKIEKRWERKLEKVEQSMANYAMTFELIDEITRIKSEPEIIDTILGTFQIFFASQDAGYVTYDKVNEKYNSIPKGFLITNELIKSFDFEGAYKYDQKKDTLMMKMSLADETFGYFVMNKFTFPEYIERYIRIVQIISNVCGLGIDNARKYDQLLIAKSDAEMANATKDKFFSIIAHDLKNPFHSIINFTDMMVHFGNDFSEEEKNEFIQYVNHDANILYKLLQNLLEWARSQTGSIDFGPEALDLHDLSTNIMELLLSQAEGKQVRLENNIQEQTFAFGDKNMLMTIMRNLITNAIKYTRKEGLISLHAKGNGQFVEVSVEDNGVGISSENMGKLFAIGQKYTTVGTDKEYGTGLGLLLCKEFVEKNGGRIWVESKIDQGSTFFFTVPKHKK